MKLFTILVALVLLAVPISNSNAKDNELTQEQIQKQEELRKSEELLAYAHTLVGKRTGQCVLALRQYFSVSKDEVSGMAKNTKINSQTGKVGAVVVFRNMSRFGHVGYQITPVRQNGDFEIFHSNGDWTQRGEILTINIKDPRISGYRIIE